MKTRFYPKILLLLFAFIWLIPITFVGIAKKPIPPAGLLLNEFYRVACLFTERVPAWAEWYFQVKPIGSLDWKTVDQSVYAKMRPFGYHSRLHLMLGGTERDPNGARIRKEISKYVTKKYEAATGEDVMAIRLCKVFFKVGDPRLARPEGKWIRPQFHELDSSDQAVMYETHYTFTFED